MEKYEFYGAPKYDPRRKNRVFLAPCNNIIAKVVAFTELALERKASIIRINTPEKSTRKGYYELYSNAGVDAVDIREAMKRKGAIHRLLSRFRGKA